MTDKTATETTTKIKNGLTNHQCWAAAANMQPFCNRNKSLWGAYRTAVDGTRLFVTFSYNASWPLTAVILGVGGGTGDGTAPSVSLEAPYYFVNKDKYSVTTTRHASTVHPASYGIRPEHIGHLTRDDMVRLVNSGYTAIVKNKLGVAA